MSTTNAPITASRIGSALALAIALVGLPAHAAEGPSEPASPSSAATASKKATRPRARSRAGLDSAARRALRASSSRANEVTHAIDGERVAMRAIAPAPEGDPPKRGKSKKKGDEDERAPSDASDRRISLDEDFLVEGKLEKPNAFYILRRSQSGYDWARLDAKFLPLVLESVQDPLF